MTSYSRRLRPFRVTLVCGCVIHLRDHPVGRNAHFSCPTGVGHGYNLRWASCMNTVDGKTDENLKWAGCN